MLKKRILASSMASVMALTSVCSVAFAETKDVTKSAYGVKTKAELEAYVNSDAIKKLADSDEYLEELKEDFTLALAYAKATINDVEAVENDYTCAYLVLAVAESKMVHYTTDELKSLIASATSKLGNNNEYKLGAEGDEKWNNYEECEAARNAAQDVIDDKTTDSYTIDQAYYDLEKSLDNLSLKTVVYKDTYRKLLDSLNAKVGKLEAQYPLIARWDLPKYLGDVDALGSDRWSADTYAVDLAYIKAYVTTITGATGLGNLPDTAQTTDDTVANNYARLKVMDDILDYMTKNQPKNYKRTVTAKDYANLIAKYTPSDSNKIANRSSADPALLSGSPLAWINNLMDDGINASGKYEDGTYSDSTDLKINAASTTAAQAAGGSATVGNVAAALDQTTWEWTVDTTDAGLDTALERTEDYMRLAYILDAALEDKNPTHTANNVNQKIKEADSALSSSVNITAPAVQSAYTDLAGVVKTAQAYYNGVASADRAKKDSTADTNWDAVNDALNTLNDKVAKFKVSYQDIRDRLAKASAAQKTNYSSDLETKISECVVALLNSDTAFDDDLLWLANRPDKDEESTGEKKLIEKYNALNVEEVDAKLLKGDADLNGEVQVADATLVLKCVAKTETLDGVAYTNANVNSDDQISVADATAILKYVANKKWD